MDFDGVKFGFIGAGNMAKSIILGAVRNGVLKANDIWASAPTRKNLDALQKVGCNTITSNSRVLEECSVIVLCVKPFKLGEALEGLQQCWQNEHIVVSVISGIKIESFYQIHNVPGYVKIIRVMPNTPALVQCGVFAYSLSSTNTDKNDYSRKLFEHLFGTLGLCEEVPQDLLNVVCGLCGSGPAYVYTVIQAMSDGAVKMGLPRHLATKLAAQTVMGASKMVLETEKHPDVLRDEVCSPSGTTICGVHALERAGVRCAFMDAVEAATKRAIEQGRT